VVAIRKNSYLVFTNRDSIFYSGYAEYNQLHPPFEHGVSILDLIFNEGSNATKFMKSFNDK